MLVLKVITIAIFILSVILLSATLLPYFYYQYVTGRKIERLVEPNLVRGCLVVLTFIFDILVVKEFISFVW